VKRFYKLSWSSHESSNPIQFVKITRVDTSKDMAKADNYDFIGFPGRLVAFLKLSNYTVVAKLIFPYLGTTREALATPHTNLNIRTR